MSGCGGDGQSPDGQQKPAARVVSIGQPVAPRPVRVQRGGTLELKAAGVGRSPGFRLAVLRAPGARPRDLCVATVALGLALPEANEACDVRTAGAAAVFFSQPGIPDALGPQPTVVAGIAPPDIARIRLSGPGGRRTLPLSEHRAFLALYAHSVRGHVRITADRAGGGTAVRTASLPLSRATVFPGHQNRRRGAVFSDEVGENIIGRSYPSIVRRFGRPAVVNRERGRRCTYYEVVGAGPVGWRFCFGDDGRLTTATGEQPIPD
jgi:hypothetical protein